MANDAEDDWAPLSPEQLSQQPGAWQPPPSSQAGSGPKSTRTPLRRTAAPNPDGERLLAELQQRIAAAGGSRSLVSAVDRREQRTQRRRARAVDAQLELGAVLLRGELPAVPMAPAPEPQLDLAASDMDARETEAWFLELPAAERERLRNQWRGERHRYDGVPQARRRRLGRGAAYGAMLFLLMGLLSSLLLGGFGLLPLLVATGAVGGLCAEALGGGRMRYGIAGGLGFAVVMGPLLVQVPMLMWNVALAGYGMGVLGMDGEMRRSAGYAED